MIGEAVLEPLVFFLKALNGGNELGVAQFGVIPLLLFLWLRLGDLLLLLFLHHKRNIINRVSTTIYLV